MREFVSVTTQAVALGRDQDEIVLSVYGPRGGTLVNAGLSVENARALIGNLELSVRKFDERDGFTSAGLVASVERKRALTPTHYFDVPDGKWHLMHDREDDDWALWWKRGDHVDHMYIAWDGKVRDPPHTSRSEWMQEVLDRCRCYVIDTYRADQCVMAALAFTTPGQWFQFAARMVGKAAT